MLFLIYELHDLVFVVGLNDCALNNLHTLQVALNAVAKA